MAGRGRPKNFDPLVALEQIAGVFWEKGYAGASVEDLTLAANIKRPSLYASFGDKRTSFLAALGLHRGRLQARLSEFENAPYIRSALSDLFDHSILEYLSGQTGPRGSFILTIAIDAAEQSDVRIQLIAILHEMDAAFVRRFSRAISEGELDTAMDPVDLAAVLSSVLQSLALRARAGETAEKLSEMASRAVTFLLT